MALNIKPLGTRVVVKVQEAETKTKSGIYIPDSAKEKPQRGEIVAVGNGTKDEAMELKSGDIVLFHNDSKYILDALPTILKSYREQGFTVVPISELLLTGETTLDAQGIQHPAPTTIPEV